MALALAAVVAAPPASATADGSCTPATRAALDAGSSVSGGSATLVVPEGTCPVTVSFSSYSLPGGQKLPFEDQVLFDNVTSTYGPGTYDLSVDVPACAHQTDLYLGPVLAPLGPSAHGGRVFDYDLVGLGDACGGGTAECTSLDFETDGAGQALTRGQVIDDEFSALGLSFSTGGQKLLVFDTADVTGGDVDLRTPGPGPGNGTALGKVLVLSEDGDESDPDDDRRGGTITLSFAEAVDVEAVDILDVDADESVTVRAYDAAGALVATVPAGGAGDNGFQTVAVGAEGVRRLEVEFSSSGALAGLVFCEPPGDVCEADQGPPQIRYAFGEPDRVVVTVTDDTGIADIDVDLEDTEGGTPNLVLVGDPPDLSGFPREVVLTYRLTNFTQNTLVRVRATDRCGQIECPDDGVPSNDEISPLVRFEGADGSDDDSDPDDATVGFALHPDGLQGLPVFFRLVNTEVVSNVFTDATQTRAEYRLETIDKGRGGTFGLIAASACNATVIDPEVGTARSDLPAAPFLARDGLVVMEAEHATDRAAGSGGAAGHAWEDVGAYGRSRGSAVQAGPNAGFNARDGLSGPRLDFEVEFEEAGTYYLWVRLHADSGRDNSVHAGLDGEAATFGNMGLEVPRWSRWRWTNRVRGRDGADRVRVTVDQPGTRTVSVWMREDGVRLDRLLLTTDRSFRPRGRGPSESGRAEASADAAVAQGVTADAVAPQVASLLVDEAVEFGLAQNYPNPTRGQTTVEFSVPEAGPVRLAVFNMLGQEVLVLAEGEVEAGHHSVQLRAGDLASGTYVYRLSTPTESATRRLTVAR